MLFSHRIQFSVRLYIQTILWKYRGQKFKSEDWHKALWFCRVCNPVTLATASVCASSHSLEPRDVGVLQSQLMLLLSSGMSSDLYFHVQDLKKLQKKRWLQVYLLDWSINRKGPQPRFYVPLQLHYYFPHSPLLETLESNPQVSSFFHHCVALLASCNSYLSPCIKWSLPFWP